MNFQEIVEECGLESSEKRELAAYCGNYYADRISPGTSGVCSDGTGEAAKDSADGSLEVWNRLIVRAGLFGAGNVINSSLCSAYPVDFARPDLVKIEMYSSFAGNVPIIYAGDDRDFESLVTNIAHKGVRPSNLEKTGALFLSGKTIRFIILSSKPYSNVTAAEVGLGEEEWREKSMCIRRSHECTHLFTKKMYGCARNNLHDELMADFIGLYDAFGFYRADWFLRFMGVIPGSGSRLVYYTQGLPGRICDAVSVTAREAAYALERWSHTESFRGLSYGEMIRIMCREGLFGILTIA